jgi:RimJ/RimL family protein N-acetyltransferase
MTFNTQPILEDSLVHLRPLLPEDIEPLWAVASDPLMWDQHPAKRHQRDVYEKLFADSIASKGAMVIIDKATGKIIGSSRYLWPEGVTTVIEIGYSYLARAYWGGIYNSAVKTLMLNHRLIRLTLLSSTSQNRICALEKQLRKSVGSRSLLQITHNWLRRVKLM